MGMKYKGFTLIELLIVIAVLGVLAGGVLVAINPLEKIAKAKDSTKKSTVSQLTNALQSYYTLNGGKYPTASSTWIDNLVTNGDLKNVPPPAGGTACTTNNQNGYCYKTNADQTEAIVYTSIESSERPSGTSGTTPYIIWSSASGESGTYYSIASDIPDPVVTSGFTSGPTSTLTQGLAGWWKMNGNADDSSGNGNNGTVKNGAFLTTDKNGYSGKAYDFDGANDMIQTGASNTFNIASELTYSAWFYVDTGNSGWQRPFQKFQDLSDGNGIPYGIQYGAVSKKWGCEYRNAAQTEYPNVRSSSAYNSGSWYHVACVASKTGDTKFALYVNGGLAGSQNTWFTSGDIDTGSRPITIGGARTAGTYWNGKIDDVRIYNRALTAGEVSNLFSAGPQ